MLGVTIMVPDIKTIIMIMVLTRLIQIVVFSHQLKHNKNYKDIKYWLLWSIFESLGFSVMFFRDFQSIFNFVVVFQNTFLLSAIISLYLGTLKYLGLPRNYRSIIITSAVYLFVLVFFSFFKDDLAIRSFTVNLYLLVYSILVGLSLYKNSGKRKKLQKLLSFTFIIYSAVLVLRLYAVVNNLYDLKDMFDSHPVNLLSFSSGLVVSIIWTFGYIVLVNEKVSEELRISKEHFELLFNTIPDPVTLTRLSDGLILNANRSFYDLFNFDKTVIGKKTPELNIWADVRQRENIVDIMEEKGEINNAEVRLKRNDEEFKALFSAKTVNMEEEVCLIGIGKDISDYLKLKAESDEKIRAMINEMELAMAVHEMIYDENGNPVDYRFIEINPSFERMTGLVREKVVGRNCKEILPGVEDFWIEKYAEITRSGIPETFENYSSVLKKWYKVYAYRTRENEFAVVFEDISKRKIAHDDLIAKAEELRKFNELMVDREIRMTELKEEINKLLKEAGKEPKY